MIARSTLWGTIQLGDAFYTLSELEQRAIIAHEEGHIHHRHAWKRLARIVTFRWRGLFELCELQELEADRYASARGYRAGLITFLFRTDLHVKSAGYPTGEQRLENLRHVR